MWPNFTPGRFLVPPATPAGRNFCLPKKCVFPPPGHLPPLFFLIMDLQKKIFCFVLSMNICNWKTYHLNDATLLLGSKWKRIRNWDFPKMGFLWKNILVIFYCCFFRFLSKHCQKVKVTNLTKNCQNYQILFETCFLRSLDTIG